MREIDPSIECEGIGGQRMKEAGMTLRHDLAAEAIMGFVEVVKHFGAIRKLFHNTAGRIREWKPDAVVLIDYPGFNIRLAKALHGSGIPVVYYISPQVWAWKKARIHTLAQVCRRMITIFPFEKEMYDAAGLDCVFAGHPIVDGLSREVTEHQFGLGKVIAILPGSREQEIQRILPTMIDTARRIAEEYPDAIFMSICVDEERKKQIQAIAGDFPLHVFVGVPGMMKYAHACMVASGTATVEVALFGVPMVILYKVNPLTYWMARAVVDIDHIGMVNILAGRGIVPEFIQHQATPEAILPAIRDLIEDTPVRTHMIHDLEHVRLHLGGSGASQRAAEAVLEIVQEQRIA